MPIKTPHVGTPPRSQKVTDFIFARGSGADCDAAMTVAMAETASHQTDAGIVIVSDVELSKVSHATCVKNRFGALLKGIFDAGGTPLCAGTRPDLHSPGVISRFLQSAFFRTREAYRASPAEAAGIAS